MLEVGIPVYHSRQTITDALDSLVVQTNKNFIVCLSVDGDGETYTDIIRTYRARGLNIRTIKSEINGGPGAARQKIIDTTQCDYIMFLDADDILMPQAIEYLYKPAKAQGFDILRSSFIREEKDKPDITFPHDIQTVTWCHGKIYRVNYLKENNIRFLDGLKTDEDAFFNLIAWNCAENRGSVNQITYYWRFNQTSITRRSRAKEYFSETYVDYIRSQVEGLKEIYRIKGEINSLLITFTLINIYDYYMQILFYKLSEKPANQLLDTIKHTSWMQKFLNTPENWFDIARNVKASKIIGNEYIIFYQESFSKWASRVLK